MLNHVVLLRVAMCRAGEMALAEDSETEAVFGEKVRSIGSAMAMIFAIWLMLLGMVVLTSSL